MGLVAGGGGGGSRKITVDVAVLTFLKVFFGCLRKWVVKVSTVAWKVWIFVSVYVGMVCQNFIVCVFVSRVFFFGNIILIRLFTRKNRCNFLHWILMIWSWYRLSQTCYKETLVETFWCRSLCWTEDMYAIYSEIWMAVGACLWVCNVWVYSNGVWDMEHIFVSGISYMFSSCFKLLKSC